MAVADEIAVSDDDTVASAADVTVDWLARDVDTVLSEVPTAARPVLSDPTDDAVFDSDVDTFPTAVAIDAVDEEVLVSDVETLPSADAIDAVDEDTLVSDVLESARPVVRDATDEEVLVSDVETLPSADAIDAVDEDTLVSDVFVLARPVLSDATDEEVLVSDVETLPSAVAIDMVDVDTLDSWPDTCETVLETCDTALETVEMSLANDEIWLEIELDSPAVSCPWAAEAPSHDVTPLSSSGKGKGTPNACKTTADDPTINSDLTPRAPECFPITYSPVDRSIRRFTMPVPTL